MIAALSAVLRQLKVIFGGEGHARANFILLHSLDGRGPTRLSDLAADLGLDVSTVSRHIRALESLDQVRRTPDPDDGRATRLELTGTGRAELQRVLALRRETFGVATAHWSDADRTALTALLCRLADDLTTFTKLETR